MGQIIVQTFIYGVCNAADAVCAAPQARQHGVEARGGQQLWVDAGSRRFALRKREKQELFSVTSGEQRPSNASIRLDQSPSLEVREVCVLRGGEYR